MTCSAPPPTTPPNHQETHGQAYAGQARDPWCENHKELADRQGLRLLALRRAASIWSPSAARRDHDHADGPVSATATRTRAWESWIRAMYRSEQRPAASLVCHFSSGFAPSSKWGSCGLPRSTTDDPAHPPSSFSPKPHPVPLGRDKPTPTDRTGPSPATHNKHESAFRQRAAPTTHSRCLRTRNVR